MNSPDQINKKNNDIEILRCFAILFTFAQHLHTLLPHPTAWLNTVGKHFGFWTGVDLFFVISGFVITKTLSSLYEKMESGREIKTELLGFWVKRVFRLFPAAWLWLLIPLFLSLFLSEANITPSPKTLFEGALASFLHVANVYFPYCIANNTLGGQCGSFHLYGHYWSLSLEEQFYIILPLAIMFIPHRRLITGLIVLIVIHFFWYRPVLGYGSYFRMDGFFWGILLALSAKHSFYQKIEPVFLTSLALRVLAIGILLYLLAKIPAVFSGLGIAFTGSPVRYATGLIAATGAALVWVASYGKGYVLGNSAISRPLVAIGGRSYSLYLIHLPMFYILNKTWMYFSPDFLNDRLENIAVLIVSLIVVFILSELNYRYIEQPFRLWGRNLAKRIYKK